MRILFVSHFFAPSVGGLETVSHLLAEEMARAGHQVDLVTSTSSTFTGEQALPFRIHRRPRFWQLYCLAERCDIVFHNNVSLKVAWPLLFLNRHWVVAHHVWLTRTDGSLGWQDKLKRIVGRFATSVAVSRALGQALPSCTKVIPNPYDAGIFRRPRTGTTHRRDFIFLGRLVSDKGVDLLIEAFALYLLSLPDGIAPPGLTIVGRGPEEERVRALASKLGVATRVFFAGTLRGQALVDELWRHRVLVVPSRWAEPFGLVALEGMACGCVVIGSDRGGLAEAIGEAGLIFRSGNAEDLAAKLRLAMHDENLAASLDSRVPAHLAKHHPRVVANIYLDLFQRLVAERSYVI